MACRLRVLCTHVRTCATRSNNKIFVARTLSMISDVSTILKVCLACALHNLQCTCLAKEKRAAGIEITTRSPVGGKARDPSHLVAPFWMLIS